MLGNLKVHGSLKVKGNLHVSGYCNIFGYGYVRNVFVCKGQARLHKIFVGIG